MAKEVVKVALGVAVFFVIRGFMPPSVKAYIS